MWAGKRINHKRELIGGLGGRESNFNLLNLILSTISMIELIPGKECPGITYGPDPSAWVRYQVRTE
jgi:hypothetical protein